MPVRPVKQGFRIRRGDVFLVNLGASTDGKRVECPVLVIQNDIGNRLCESVIVVPLTPDVRAKRLWFGVLVEGNPGTGLRCDCVALFSQIRTLEKNRFHPEGRLGRIGPEAMAKVNEAIKISLGLSTLQQLQTRTRARTWKMS
jgi:mRNA interferase MazF